MYNIIREIAAASGNEKKQLLIKHDSPVLRNLLRYAYDPFKRYYITAPGLEGVEGGDDLGVMGRAILDQLASRKLSGQLAIETVSDYVSCLSPNAAVVFQGIINKDLRLGIGLKTINQVYPGLIPYSADGSRGKVDLMLCKTFDPASATYPLCAAIKKDGVRARAVTYELYTRANQRFIGFDHIEDELEKYTFEKDGEMMVPGQDFDGASGLIRNNQPVPTAVYWLFDCPSIDASKWARYQFLKENVVETDHIKIIEHRIINNQEELMEFYHQALVDGEEGLVVYTINHEYRDARSYDWCRLVPIQKADCKVIGFEEGEGKLVGSLGKLIVDFNGVPTGVGTGFNEKLWDLLTDAEKKKAAKDGKGYTEEDYESRRRGYIWDHKPEFLNAIAEIHYKEKTSKGSMRQPRFKGWRFDKQEANCE